MRPDAPIGSTRFPVERRLPRTVAGSLFRQGLQEEDTDLFSYPRLRDMDPPAVTSRANNPINHLKTRGCNIHFF